MYNTYRQFGYAILHAYTKEHNVVQQAVDFMVKHCKDARWDIVTKAIRIMEEGFKEKQPYTCELVEWINREMEKQFNQDMIYYTICYDGFRL